MKYKFFNNETQLKFVFQDPETFQEGETFYYHIEDLDNIFESLSIRLEEDIPERERSMLEILTREINNFLRKEIYGDDEESQKDMTKYEEVL